MRQTDSRTDGRTSDRYIEPASRNTPAVVAYKKLNVQRPLSVEIVGGCSIVQNDI